MADFITRFEADEGVSRANFNSRIDEANKAIAETADAANDAAALAANAQARIIGKNLLHNWYFKNPVNSKGITSIEPTVYVAPIFIDRWALHTPFKTKAELTEDGLKYYGKNIWGGVTQQLDSFEELKGKTVTFSVLYSDIASDTYIQIGDGVASKESKAITEAGLYSLTFNVSKNATRLRVVVAQHRTASYDTTTEMCTIVAAKLEVGDKQTLAYQDADGNWVLNEIPDFGEQAAICSQYSLETDNNFTVNYIGAAKPFALVQSYTASTTLTAGNMGNFISMNSTADLTVTVPLDATANFPIGAELEVCRMGSGAVNFVPETVETTTEVDGESVTTTEAVTLNSVDGALSISAQYGCAALKKIAANRWLISGSLE